MQVEEQARGIKEQLHNLTACRAVNLLHFCFDNGDCDIQIRGSFTTPLNLLKEKPDLALEPADKIRCRFFGGPSGRQGFYDGTLVTLLADRVMWAVANKREDLLSRFLNVKL